MLSQHHRRTRSTAPVLLLALCLVTTSASAQSAADAHAETDAALAWVDGVLDVDGTFVDAASHASNLDVRFTVPVAVANAPGLELLDTFSILRLFQVDDILPSNAVVDPIALGQVSLQGTLRQAQEHADDGADHADGHAHDAKSHAQNEARALLGDDVAIAWYHLGSFDKAAGNARECLERAAAGVDARGANRCVGGSLTVAEGTAGRLAVWDGVHPSVQADVQGASFSVAGIDEDLDWRAYGDAAYVLLDESVLLLEGSDIAIHGPVATAHDTVTVTVFPGIDSVYRTPVPVDPLALADQAESMATAEAATAAALAWQGWFGPASFSFVPAPGELTSMSLSSNVNSVKTAAVRAAGPLAETTGASHLVLPAAVGTLHFAQGGAFIAAPALRADSLDDATMLAKHAATSGETSHIVDTRSGALFFSGVLEGAAHDAVQGRGAFVFESVPWSLDQGLDAGAAAHQVDLHSLSTQAREVSSVVHQVGLAGTFVPHADVASGLPQVDGVYAHLGASATNPDALVRYASGQARLWSSAVELGFIGTNEVKQHLDGHRLVRQASGASFSVLDIPEAPVLIQGTPEVPVSVVPGPGHAAYVLAQGERAAYILQAPGAPDLLLSGDAITHAADGATFAIAGNAVLEPLRAADISTTALPALDAQGTAQGALARAQNAASATGSAGLPSAPGVPGVPASVPAPTVLAVPGLSAAQATDLAWLEFAAATGAAPVRGYIDGVGAPSVASIAPVDATRVDHEAALAQAQEAASAAHGQANAAAGGHAAGAASSAADLAFVQSLQASDVLAALDVSAPSSAAGSLVGFHIAKAAFGATPDVDARSLAADVTVLFDGVPAASAPSVESLVAAANAGSLEAPSFVAVPLDGRVLTLVAVPSFSTHSIVVTTAGDGSGAVDHDAPAPGTIAILAALGTIAMLGAASRRRD